MRKIQALSAFCLEFLKEFPHQKLMNEKFIQELTETRKALEAVLEPTPLQKNAFLSQKYRAEIYIKREDLTPVRSYKLRGAFNVMRLAIAQGHTRFVCASAGNHAQGVAYAAKHFDVQATIFMPSATPGQKIMKTRSFGGKNINIALEGDYFDITLEAAINYAQKQNAFFLPPFDDENVITGQSTIAAEIYDELDDVDIFVMPVGGGGLSAGVMKFLQATKRSAECYFVEPEGASSLYESLLAQKATPLSRVDSFVDGAAVAKIGQRNFEYLRNISPDHVIRVPENRLCMTMLDMLNIEGIVLEPAGALAIDALQDIDVKGKRVVVIASGGNFDFERLPDVKERAMRFEGRKKYFILRLPQRPGALKDFLNMLGPHDDIARFEYMKKSARQYGTVLLGIETDRPENFEILQERMEQEGFGFTDITHNAEISELLI